MASILFGGPQWNGEHNPVHDDLIAKLMEEHKVLSTVSGKEMIAELSFMRLAKDFKEAINARDYDLIIYDTGLFYDQAPLGKRADAFTTHVSGYLRYPELPVIVLAEEEMSDLILPETKAAGFTQINQPYEIDDVIEKINYLL